MANEELKSFKYFHPSATREASVDSCGKTILVGEHAVLYGARAVALPLRSMKLSLSFASRPVCEKVKPVVRMDGLDDSAHASVVAVIERACELLCAEGMAIEVTGRSHIPLGAGFGSSAALCVAILRGVAQIKGETLNESRLAYLANELEKRFHGNPSGLDTATIAYDSCIRFRRGGSPEVLPLKDYESWPFLLVHSGLKASTKSMIQVAQPYFQGARGATRISRFDRLVSRVETGLRLGDHSLVADAMNQASHMLVEAGVVTDGLKSIISECMNIGCRAAKVTGAGGGGAVLVLLDQKEASLQRSKLLKLFGERSIFDVGL